MKRRFLVLVTAFVLMGVSFAYAEPTAPYTSADCDACHGASRGVWDAASSADFSVSAVPKASTCISCHSTKGSTYVQSYSEDPGAFPHHTYLYRCWECHESSWGAVFAPRWPAASTSAGFFREAGSITKPSSEYHAIHKAPRWPVNVTYTGTHVGWAALNCAGCHAVASCESCHAAIDPSHARHSYNAAAGTWGVTPWEGDVATGTANYLQAADRTAEKVACSASGCHGWDVKPVPARIEDANAAMVYAGTWVWDNSSGNGSKWYEDGSARYTEAAGASVTTTFTGTSVSIVGPTGGYYGIWNVYVDGVWQATVDQYPGLGYLKTLWSKSGMVPGQHNITLVCSGTRNPSAFYSRMSIDRIEYSTPSGEAWVPDCLGCHAAKTAFHGYVEADHLAADGTAGARSCSSCHSLNLKTDHMKATSSASTIGCAACHGNGRPVDLLVGAWDKSCATDVCHGPATARPAHATDVFAPVNPVDRDEACVACHSAGLVGTHPLHQVGANCGAACHPGWGTTRATAVPAYTDPQSGASFATAASKSTPAAVLHIIHAAPRWPAGVDTPTSACASCHSAAACDACHTGAIAADHAAHSASDQAANPAWTGVVGYGVVDGDQTLHSAFSDSNQCASVDCHDVAGSAANAPRTTENFNHIAGGNPDDPSSTSSAITTTGVWRWRASNRYSGSHMSYNNQPTASLTAAFNGARVEVVSDRDPYRGIAEVLVDGVVRGYFDGYSATTKYQDVVISIDVAAGPHTITVRPTGGKSASARGEYVVVDGFRVYPEVPGSIAPGCADCHP